MKSEERIIELLSEYLIKTDRILEEMVKNDLKFSEQNKSIIAQSESITAQNESITAQNERITAQNERIDLAYQALLKHAEEIKQLRQETLKHEIQNQEILKEIFSISKRVSNIEDKQ